MGKYSGMIGFASNEEIAPSLFDDRITERPYYGDILKNIPRYSTETTLSGGVQYNNSFSIVGDTYAFQHLTDIRYITWKGNKWIVDSSTEAYPRIEITIGGLWNGQTPET